MIKNEKIPMNVRNLFGEISLDLYKKGYKRYSSDAILHRIRWHFEIEKENRHFKCNDHWTSSLSRWAMKKWPELSDFFETRKVKTQRLTRGTLEDLVVKGD